MQVKASQSIDLSAAGGFIVQDNAGASLFVIDSNGNASIKGTLTQDAEPTADTNDFAMQNSTGGLNLALTQPEGNLLIKNSLNQNQNSPLSPALNSFVIS